MAQPVGGENERAPFRIELPLGPGELNERAQVLRPPMREVDLDGQPVPAAKLDHDVVEDRQGIILHLVDRLDAQLVEGVIEVSQFATVDFHGVGMNWVGDMTGAEMMSQMQNAYSPSLITRDTIWTFKAGKPVYLLREPGGPSGVGPAGIHQGSRSKPDRRQSQRAGR